MTTERFAHHCRYLTRKGAGLLLPLVLCALPLFADFDDLGVGARSIGMGNAFTAIADDAFGMYYNPAGLGLVRTSQIGTEFGKLYFGLDDDSNLVTGFSAAAFPLYRAQLKAVAVSTQAFVSDAAAADPGLSEGSLKTMEYRHIGTVAVGWKYFSLENYYQESAYYLGFGRPVGERWAWGVNVKYLQEKYTIDDYLRASPVFRYGEKSGVDAVSVDAGLMVNLAPRLFLGLAARDINQPNTGLSVTDQLPCTGMAGLAWKDRDVAWGINGTYRREHWYYSTGFEKMLNKTLAVRSGISYGERNYFNIAGGFSFNFYRARLDYVFQYPLSGLEDISGTHRMSLLLKFGRRQKDEMETGSLEYYYEKLQDQLESTRRALAAAQEEKKNLENMLVEEARQQIRERARPAGEAKAAVPEKAGSGGILTPGQALVIPAPARQQTAGPVNTASVPAQAPIVSTASAAVPPAEPAVPAPVEEKPAPVKTVPAAREPKKAAQPRPAVPARHTVQLGENLRGIAVKYYGNGDRWRDIYKANRDKVTGGQVKPGQVIVLPQ
jgi:hypothetical protein